MPKATVLDQYPEVKILLDLVSQSDKLTLTNYIKRIHAKNKNDPKAIPLTKQLVNDINRAEISLTKGILFFGATLALFQGQMSELKILTESEVSKNIPGIYNLLALEALILKGDNYRAFSWISKALQTYSKIKERKHIDEKHPIFGEEIFTHILEFYCYYLMGKNEEAENSLEEVHRLHALAHYSWNYYYFWLLYFNAKIAYNYGNYEEVLEIISEASQIFTALNHRIYKGLCLQLKGRALVDLEKNVDGLNLYSEAKENFLATNSVFSLSIYADIGILETKVGRYNKAQLSFQKTINETQQLSGGGLEVAPLLQLPGYKGLAELYLIQGNYFRAEDSFLKTLRLAKNTNAVELEAYCLEKLGSINTDLKKYTEAQNYFSHSLQITTDFELNKTNTLLEYGRLALLMNNIDLAQTQLWYLRSLSHTKNLGHQITLFKAQIMMAESKFEEARLQLEKIQLRQVLKKDFLQLRIQVALAKLVLMELQLGSDDIESEDECIEEFIDRINLIKPYLVKENFPALKILFALLNISSQWLLAKENLISREAIIEELKSLLAIASNENKLIHLSQLINFYIRRFKRQRIRLDISHTIELIENLERVLILLSPKS